MYVLYKENNIPGVGGVHPQGIETGLAYYKGWNLADCPDEKVHFYKEFDFIAVSGKIALGLQVLDRIVVENVEVSDYNLNLTNDPLIGKMGAPVSSEINVSLSELDKENMELAKTFINNLELKLITRAKVREIKDVEDDLVDLKRVVHSLITFVVDDWRVKSDDEKSKSRFKTVLDDLDITVADNVGVLSTIEKDLKKLENIVDLEVEIAKVVDNYYLTKKL
jgi:hypothetical protein